MPGDGRDAPLRDAHGASFVHARAPSSSHEGEPARRLDHHHGSVVVTQRPQVVLWSPSPPSVLVDVVVESATIALSTAGQVGRLAGATARPFVGVLLRPPLVVTRLQPATWLEGLARKGQVHRQEAEAELARLLDRLVPLVLQEVLDRVDLNQVVLERLDVDAVIGHVDLRSLAEQVIAAVDLPEIIRTSTTSVTSETVRGVRMRSISADDAVARATGRLRSRRRRQPQVTETPPVGDRP
jgi:hypothetical protein